MLIKDLFQKSLDNLSLANEGVAKIENSDEVTLRFEIEHFVCEGQYEKSLDKILSNFIAHAGKAGQDQKATWISGFFGSGKSHLVKMLRYLWIDYKFADGASARELAHLPESVQTLLKELSAAAKRNKAPLHAAGGTLSSGNDQVRSTILGFVYKSLDLPESEHQARFRLWLRREEIETSVDRFLQAKGKSLASELSHLHVSTHLADALLAAKPDLADSSKAVLAILKEQFPARKNELTNDELVERLKDALDPTGKAFPFTLLVLDEAQQFIADSQDRALRVQEIAETLCSKLQGRLTLIATGQTAMSGTPMLSKLTGRFPFQPQLSDQDIDAVVRRIVLAKKPDQVKVIKDLMQRHAGDISRQLAGSRIAHVPEDENFWVADYPLLPVRRRFWEKCLHATDRTGTMAALRSHLRVVLEAAKTAADQELGWLVPADFLFTQKENDFIQTGILDRELFNKIAKLKASSDPDQQLQGRVASIIFLINKLHTGEAGPNIRATADVLADLAAQSFAECASLRSVMPRHLEQLENQALIMQIDGEYRIQTSESSEWYSRFNLHKNELVTSGARLLQEERVRLFSSLIEVRIPKSFKQGQTKESRSFAFVSQREPSTEERQGFTLWMRDAWDATRDSVLAEAKRAGPDSALISVFVAKQQQDTLEGKLAEFCASQKTLDEKGSPSTEEGKEARRAIEARRDAAKRSVESIFKACLDQAEVFLGGGEAIRGASLEEKIDAAATSSLKRLYSEFDAADHAEWGKVFDKAKKGATDAIKTLDPLAELESHPVTRLTLSLIGSGISGAELRKKLAEAPRGWSQDAIDGAIYALLAAEKIIAKDAAEKPVTATKLERRDLTRTHFRAEQVPLSAKDKITARKILGDLGIPATSGAELEAITALINSLQDLRSQAGGTAPAPEKPSEVPLRPLLEASGNSLIHALIADADTLKKLQQTWQKQAESIQKRLPAWDLLQKLLALTPPAQSGLAELKAQVAAIENDRLLLQSPDPVQPLLDSLSKSLRHSLQQAVKACQASHEHEASRLQQEESLHKLSPEQRVKISLPAAPSAPTCASTEELIRSLQECPLAAWSDRKDAIASRFDKIREEVTQLLAPKAKKVELPRRTLHTDADLQAWLKEVETKLRAEIAKAPVYF